LILADTYAGWKGSLPEPVPEERLAACLKDASLPPHAFTSKYVPEMFGKLATDERREELASIMSAFHPDGFRLMATALAQADTRELLANIGVPTLLIWGDADARSPITVAQQFRDAIPGARLAIIPGAGHVSNLEEPALFDSEVRRFCQSAPDT
jgi:pimeloyl-ACP methyl ester carboxylesterase